MKRNHLPGAGGSKADGSGAFPVADPRLGPPITRLAAPILAENLVRTSLIAVDQLMLYAFATEAAAAMSASSQLSFFLQLLYAVPAQGAGILVAQRLGAGRREEAESYALGGIILVGLFAIAVSLSYVLLSGPALSLFSLEPRVFGLAKSFLSIYGGLSLFMALNIAQAAVLRAWGHTRAVMSANITALVVTVLGNYVALFGPFGLPVTGLKGVAVANAAGQAVAFLVLGVAMRRHGIRLAWRRATRLPRQVLRGILAIGAPTAGENISYNLSQVTIMGIVTTMGTAAVAAFGLVTTLARYLFIFGVSVGVAAQIKVGRMVGAGIAPEARSRMMRWLGAAMCVAFSLALALNLGKGLIIPVFTRDATIAGLVATLLFVSPFYEPGRCVNTVVIPGLKGAGDVGFPVTVGVLLNWCLGVPAAVLFGKVFGFGLLGVYLAMSLEEWTRGSLILARWRSGKWIGKARTTAG